MECLTCGSDCTRNGTERDGTQKWTCKNTECTKRYFTDKDVGVTTDKPGTSKPKVGMSMNEFKKKYDTDYIVNTRVSKVMGQLSKNLIYEKSDVVKLTQLSNSYPGLSDKLAEFEDQQGRTNSRTFYGHPETIAQLKEQAKLM